MPRLTIRFESACVFMPRPGVGLDVFFASVPHHRTVLRTGPEVLLQRSRVELLFDGQPASAGACVVIPPCPVDLAQVWPGATVREVLRTRGTVVPDDLDAWVSLGGGELAGGFTAQSLRYVWTVPHHTGGIVLTDRASYIVEHGASDVVVRITADGAVRDVAVATGGRDGEAVFATVDPEGDELDPPLGFGLDEFLVLSGVLDQGTSREGLAVPRLVAKHDAPSNPKGNDPSVRRPTRPVCSNAQLTVA
jgi:hypothetical protein